MPNHATNDDPEKNLDNSTSENHLASYDSEFDDDLGVPDSLEISINEKGEAVGVTNCESDGNSYDFPETQSFIHHMEPRTSSIIRISFLINSDWSNTDLPEESIDKNDNSQDQSGSIPFSAVHDPAIKFKSHSRYLFIPGEDIRVRIVDNERSVASHPLNPNLYTIEFKHGPFVWCVKKRYKHIQNLHNQLKIYRATLNIPFPTKSHRERRNSLKNLGPTRIKRKCKGALPRFPNKPDGLVSYEHLHHRMRLLEDYLENLLKIEIYKRHPEIISFMELSYLSFIEDLGIKGKEGFVLKRTGSSAKTGCNCFGLSEGTGCMRCNFFCTSLCASWNSRHLVVKDTFVAYINPKDGRIKTVILMDNGFEVSSGMYTTGLRNGLQILNSSRHIVFKCWTRRKAKEWLECIQAIANNEGKEFVQTNPHKSFAPYRSATPATWFVDGSSYMSAVADALESAKEEIFIADWWLSPEIFMKRPVTSNGDYWRLDKILQRKALEGVKIFVMIYKEVEMALGINSYYSKQKLVQCCPENIKVMRHPDHARGGVLLWAHHEKIVIVDQSLAFVGGIDLCYGRWDDNQHRLTDLGSVHHSSIYIPSKGKVTTSSSNRSKKFRADKHVLMSLAVATNTIAMATSKFLPIPPPTMINKTITPAELSLTRFMSLDNPIDTTPQESVVEGDKCNTPEMQRKNLFVRAKSTVDKVKYNVKAKRREFINMVYSPNEAGDEDNDGDDEEDEIDNASRFKSEDLDNLTGDVESNKLDVLTGVAKIWLGKDYTNFIVKDFDSLERPYQDLVDRSTTPRMPWHDVGIMVRGAAARDVARHFIQRWNAIKIEKAKLNVSYPFLLPKSYKNCDTDDSSFVDPSMAHRVKCQVLRSVSSWSAGFLEPDTIEQSIHEAYIDAISNAERYIYIENQFFITHATNGRSSVKNCIGETLLKRILRAHREGSVFKVFVVMPLLPGFEGEVGEPSGTALHAITHWNYSSISRGRDAILNQLVELGIKDPSEYITFHGLRTHSLLNGTMVTELIYVHSKLMIVDDNTVICGSANINDRSMIATRDSEIAVIIHDEEFTDGTMNGMAFPCGKFAGSLRKELFREHLGLLWSDEIIQVDDIIKESFYRDIWCARSNRNTEIFERVFRCIPTNGVVNFAMLKIYQSEIPLCQSDPILAQQEVANVKGHLVDLPLNFLCNETLTPAASTVEGIMPTSLWT